MHFSIIIKEVVVFDLGDLVDTRFFRNILGRRWFLLESISLASDFDLSGLLATLFSQEIGEINFDSGRWPGSQVIWAGFGLLFLKFNELLLDHFDLLLFTLHLNALLFFLSGR